MNKSDLIKLFRKVIMQVESISNGLIEITDFNVRYEGYKIYTASLKVNLIDNKKLLEVAVVNYRFDLSKLSYKDIEFDIQSSIVEVCMNTERLCTNRELEELWKSHHNQNYIV